MYVQQRYYMPYMPEHKDEDDDDFHADEDMVDVQIDDEQNTISQPLAPARLWHGWLPTSPSHQHTTLCTYIDMLQR